MLLLLFTTMNIFIVLFLRVSPEDVYLDGTIQALQDNVMLISILNYYILILTCFNILLMSVFC